MILILHAHMDHLSISTLSDLEDKFAGAKLIFPKGTEEFMPDYDFEFIRMKTGNSSKKNYIGETKIIDSVKITTVYGPFKDCEEISNFSHVASYGALLIFDNLKSKYMLPVHYVALEYRRDPDYPILVLKELIEKRDNSISLTGSKNIYKERVIIIDEGEQYVFEPFK